jgi:hypothetical protein
VPKRPRSHKLEDQSRNSLCRAFVSRGWTVENLTNDYGEDLLVRIFASGAATAFSFFVQAKATDNIVKYRNRAGRFYLYPVKSTHLRHWERFWQPVIFTLWDSRTDTTYWESVQTFCETVPKKKTSRKGPKSIKIRIPANNMLNEEGLLRIEAHTRFRFSRFGRQQESMMTLIQILKDDLGLKIEYDDAGILSIPDGRFVPTARGQKTFFLFGQLLAQIQNIQKSSGKTSDQIVRESLREFAQTLQSLSAGDQLKVKDFFGNPVELSTIEAYCRHLDRNAELRENLELDK